MTRLCLYIILPFLAVSTEFSYGKSTDPPKKPQAAQLEIEGLVSSQSQLEERIRKLENLYEKKGANDPALEGEITEVRTMAAELEAKLVQTVFLGLENPRMDLADAPERSSRPIPEGRTSVDIPIVESMPFVIKDSLNYILAWYCDAQYLNRLMITGNQPFKASDFIFSVSDVEWYFGGKTAAPDAIITNPCGKWGVGAEGAYFQGTNLYQVILQHGKLYYLDCSDEEMVAITGVYAPIQFAVNDDNYSNNKGGFIIKLHAWSKPNFDD
jgi:hypothetical protein